MGQFINNPFANGFKAACAARFATRMYLDIEVHYVTAYDSALALGRYFGATTDLNTAK